MNWPQLDVKKSEGEGGVGKRERSTQSQSWEEAEHVHGTKGGVRDASPRGLGMEG